MPNNADIDPLSITDGKISNLANINPKKLAKATEGQVLVAQADGRFAAKSLSGDISLQASGAATVTSVVTTEGGGTTTVVTGPQGPSGAQGATGPQGEQGPAGSDATVTTSAVDSAGAVMETDLVQTSAGAGDASKPIKLDATGKIDGSMIDGNDVSYNDISNKPSSFTPSTHASTHATGGTDAIAPSDIGAATSGHNHDTAYLGITAKAADSELLDGNDSSAFALDGHTHTLSNITDAGTAAAAATGDFAASGHNHDAAYLGITAKAADSDKLDGNDSSAFALSGHNHDHNALTNYDIAEHRVIDDTNTDSQEKLWSAYQIVTQLAAKAPYNTATSTTDGLMDNTDKVFLDKLAAQISIPSSGNTAGFIGINDTSPSYRLDVDGTARFTSAVTFGGYTFPVFDGDVGKALVTDGAGTLSFSNIAVANVTGLGDSATKDVGIGSTNVAAGDHTHAAATTSADGFMSSGDKTKLDAYPDTNATHNNEFLRKDGTFTSTPAGSGSGTVNSGTANEMAFYAADGTAVSGTGAFTLENTTTQEFNIGDAANKGELGISCNSNLTSSTYPLYVGGSTRSSSYFGTTETTPTHFVTPDAGDGAACFYGHGYVALKAITSEPQLGNNYAGLYAILDQYSSTEANLWAVGTDGTETQISPHDADGNWVFNSIDRKRGKRTKINMIEVIRALEETTGRQFIFEEEL